MHIYPEEEVHVAKEDPVELIDLGFLVIETSPYFERRLHPKRNHLREKAWQPTNRRTAEQKLF